MNLWVILADQVFVPIFGLIITAFIGWVSATVARKANYTLTKEQQATLHSAMMTGIRAALMQGLGKDAAVSAAVQYALSEGAPDAIRRLKVTPPTLRELGFAKLNIITNGEAQAQSAPR